MTLRHFAGILERRRLFGVFLYAAKIALIAVVYVATARFGLSLQPVNEFATLVWPPAGIALAAVMIFGYRMWPAIFIGAFTANLLTGAPILMAVLIGVGNTLEALLGSFLLIWSGFSASISRLGDAVKFLIFAAGLSTIVSATIGTSALVLFGVAPLSEYALTWATWWVGDMLGDLIIAPMLIVWWSTRPMHYTTAPRLAEMAGLLFLILLPNIDIFRFLFPRFTEANVLYPVFVFLPLLWAGVRFGQHGSTVAVAFTALISVAMTARGLGPFHESATYASLLTTQIYLGVASVTTLFLSALVEERQTAIAESERQRAAQALQNKDRELDRAYNELGRRASEFEMILGERTQELENANESISLEKDWFASMLKNISDGVLFLDTDGVVYYQNARSSSMFGRVDEELVGRSFTSVVRLENEDGSPLLKERFFSIITKAGKGRGSFSNLACYCIRKDGTRFHAAFVASPVFMGVQKYVGTVLVFRDITEEKRRERIRTDFLSFASHQLRAPISVIMMNAELIEIRTSADGKIDAENALLSSREIREAAEQMTALLRSLVLVSQIEAETLQASAGAADLVQVVESSTRALSDLFERKRIVLETAFDPRIPPLRTDEQLVEIVIQNLLSNAAKYTNAGGRVTVTTRVDGAHAHIVVSDNGMGIPKEDQPMLFQKLYRASNAREHEGSGLGLYIVRSIVELLDGKISFVSENGHGTTFSIRLPIHTLDMSKEDVMVL